MTKNIIYFALGVVMAFLLIKGCDNGNTTVSIPERKGRFDAIKPKHKDLSPQLKNEQKLSKNDKSKWLKKDQENKDFQKIIDSLLAENIVITEKFEKSNDQEKTKMFEKNMALKEFSQTFDDSIIEAEVNGIVAGEVKAIALNYKTKKQSITVKKPIMILVGASVGTNKELNQGIVQGNLIYQNRKNKQFTMNYVKVENQEYYLVGVNIPIFTIN